MKDAAAQPLIQVEHLSISFPLEEENVLAVRDVSFSLEQGKTLGLVGESGCGKSVTAFSILRLLPQPGRIDSGRILYKGRDIAELTDEEMRKIRGREIAMIFQEPMTSLNPVFTIGSQIEESIRLHCAVSKQEAKERALELLDQVGIPNPVNRYKSYPHEFSGGMRQRVMIAIALAGEPEVLIADEPTTALDVTIQAQILDLLLGLQEKRNMSLILITHDLGIVANMADTIAVMYAGEIVECGPTDVIYQEQGHPYTRGLFEAIPKIGTFTDRLKSIPGTVPSISLMPEECVFYPRCPMGSRECRNAAVPLIDKGDMHPVRCIKY